MPNEPHVDAGVSYVPCRYGESRLLFRGPKKPLDGRHISFLGSSQTFGRFLPNPYPAQVEEQLGVTCINFGQINASVDAFLHDPTVIEACRDSAFTVIEVMGAANLSNRFYSVHPRRNDRFVRASSVLSAIYPEVDFSDFCFTRAMLQQLHEVAPARFPIVREELQSAWSARMRTLIETIRRPVILLWLAPAPPPDMAPDDPAEWLGTEAVFVTRGMIDRLRAQVSSVVTVTPPGRRHHSDGFLLDDADAAAAAHMVGPAVQAQAASAISAIIQAIGERPSVPSFA